MTNSASTLTIGAVARLAGVPLDTVRYYERRGLVTPPPRTAAGYRQYPSDAVTRVRFIKGAQALGFTLDEIAELLALRVTPGGGCDAVERRAQAAIARIDTKLAELARMRSALDRMTTECRAPHDPKLCPLLDLLESSAVDDQDGPPSAPRPTPLIELVYFTGCPHVEPARNAVREALERAGRAPVWQEWDQTQPDVPARIHRFGSPTILVGGLDVTGAAHTSGRTCRVDGVPDPGLIEAALVAAGAG